MSAGGTPQPGRFFEDIGFYALRGRVTGAEAGRAVEVWWRNASGTAWTRSRTTRTGGGGAYAVSQPVGHAGRIAFRTTLGGRPGTGVVSSNEVVVTVADSRVVLSRPAAEIDATLDPRLAGAVSPARRGVPITIEARRGGGSFRPAARTVTDADGRFRVRLTSGRGVLGPVTVRASYRAANRSRTEASAAHRFTRVRAQRAVVTRTTAAEVAKTYRAGCPVGRSRLSTVTLNHYGFDGRMHRGVIIVRTDLVPETKRAFARALTAGYPIDKVRNPNAYGGNDPRQMAANNTSGFNCRKVVGNPYRQSPHSYGIAVDVNPVQNPYRDVNGRWWPANGRKYIDRTPRRKGMLTKGSSMTRQFRSDDYFWGGFWSPGRDYQHFQYDR